ncbi:MAG: DUF4091 domain-containing protein [Clostridia bacterium]|nr:DUF4091 domain-containing protein [Clostridia bacterium]
MYADALKIVSSQYKHLPGRDAADINPRVITGGSMLKNEPFSFQVLYRAEPDVFCQPVSLSAVCEGLPMEAWRVDYLPVMHTANVSGEPGYESSLPGLFPDLLLPRPAAPEIEQLNVQYNASRFEKDVDSLLNATGGDYQAVWFTVNPDSRTLTPGSYVIRVTLTSLTDGSVMAEQNLALEVIDDALPDNDAYYTNWFYEDCICNLFGVELYSDAFYGIFDDYIANMTRHRQNTLLLPAFTPPLDTPVGSERMNVQLVEITRGADGWHFGFEKMRRFIRHADRNGIRTFEHCHLFSQWGAKHAPNIYNTDGMRIFGFDTDAAGEEYTAFIRAYLTAFLTFAKEEGIENRLLFHISDEPTTEHMESYRQAVNTVADLLSGYPTADAMSHVEFYKEGLVGQPIANTRSAEKFYGECPAFWLYYTGGSYEKRSANRLISNTAARTRVLGVQLYRYQAKGFLHWGYNFYYDRLSAGCFDPKSSPNAYKMYPGDTYLAYPVMVGSCHVTPSIREKLMAEAFDDLRALKLLETRIGRDAVLALCEEMLGEPVNSALIPEGDALLTLREAVNRRIQETN